MAKWTSVAQAQIAKHKNVVNQLSSPAYREPCIHREIPLNQVAVLSHAIERNDQVGLR